MQDEGIIALYLARVEDAIKKTDEKYHAYCGAIAKNILESEQDTEETLSDTWLAAWNSIPPTVPQVLRLFLARITRNLSINRYTANHTKKRGSGQIAAVLDELSVCAASASSVEGEFSAQLLSECIGHFTDALPLRERNIFIRRYFYGESVQDIARRYALSQNHVSVILNRTRKKLRTKLAEEGFLDE